MRNSNLTFGCGTEVLIESVFVRLSYYGLLEGRYTDSVNREMIDARLDDARRVFQFGQPHLIEPVLIADGSGKRLPGYCYMVELTSFQPARDPARMCSGLVLVWFQEGESDVIGEFVRSSVRQLNWADVAIDGDW
jgi:hypothetical protein